MMKPPPSYISNIEAKRVIIISALVLFCFDIFTGLLFQRIFLSSAYNFSNEISRTNSDTVILGSSTTARGINPVYLDTVLGTTSYTLAKDGTGVFYASAVLRNIEKSHQLKYIIFGIDPASFVSGYSSSNFSQIDRLLPYASQDDILRSHLHHRVGWLDMKLLSVSYPYIQVIKEILKDKFRSQKFSPNGFVSLQGSNIEASSVVRKFSSPEMKTNYEISSEALDELHVLKSEVEERGAKLILITLPLYNKKLRSLNYQNSSVMAKIKSTLSGKHLCDLSSLNSGEIESITYDSRMFYDPAHLNKIGAEKFTVHLAENIKDRCFK